MKNYCLILVYKPTFTKEQVEEKINKEINEVFKSYGITKIHYQYCDEYSSPQGRFHMRIS